MCGKINCREFKANFRFSPKKILPGGRDCKVEGKS